MATILGSNNEQNDHSNIHEEHRHEEHRLLSTRKIFESCNFDTNGLDLFYTGPYSNIVKITMRTPSPPKIVAIKQIRPPKHEVLYLFIHTSADPIDESINVQDPAAFVRNELMIWSILDTHTNIVPLLGLTTMNDLDHIWGSCKGPLAVCRYYQERSLQEYLPRTNPSCELRLELLIGVVRGLEHIHRKMVIHGDLKAANVTVESSGDLAIAKIIDFGSSKLQCWCFTGQNDQSGTMLWDSPELLEDEPRTPSSDVWAFGCAALEVQMGIYPYAGDSCPEDMDIRRLATLQARGNLPATESNLDLQDRPISKLFGATGTGKTTFINDASGENLEVGNELESCTHEVAPTGVFQIDGQDVVLVDTPGFDDTELSDTDILKRIAAFLISSYQDGHKLTGVIYLHRISDIRVGGISRRTFQILRGLCGQETLTNVLIVTNMWSDPPNAKELRNEKQLQDNPKFFQPAIAAGARMVRRPYKDSKSAHDIIRMLLDKPPVTMKFQRQIVDEGEGFYATDAALVLGEELAKMEKRHIEEIEAVKEELRLAREQNNTQAQLELREFLEQAVAESTRLSKEIRSLREGFEEERLRWESRVGAAEAAQREAEAKQREMTSELEDLRIRAERASGEDRQRLERLIDELLKKIEAYKAYKPSCVLM
ncbi:kinase-like domain-containing protein [Rhizoctonia solani]|nr:kinase-like domain-containing protein [Rhizoctonia solani]